MSKAGFLADVYKERPIGPENDEKVAARFPLESKRKCRNSFLIPSSNAS